MSSSFRLVNNMKNFTLSLTPFLITFPKNEKVLKDNFIKYSNEVLELIYLANYQEGLDKLATQKLILSKINMLDFSLEYSFKMHYISEKECKKKSNELLIISKMVYGWIKNE